MINIAKKIVVKIITKNKYLMTMPGKIIIFLTNVNVHITFSSRLLKIMKYNKLLCIGLQQITSIQCTGQRSKID